MKNIPDSMKDQVKPTVRKKNNPFSALIKASLFPLLCGLILYLDMGGENFLNVVAVAFTMQCIAVGLFFTFSYVEHNGKPYHQVRIDSLKQEIKELKAEIKILQNIADEYNHNAIERYERTIGFLKDCD